ncbi:MAG: tRNA 2-thiocytidine(32) synthetase TtcA [Myxococcota bacterium]
MTPSEQRTALHRLGRRLSRATSQAVRDFDMIEDGDRILCAVSGGKDSYVMHELLEEMRRRTPIRFELHALNVDQGHPGYPAERLHRYMEHGQYAFTMVHEDTYSVVKEKVPEGKTTCSLCSRLRRGILYSEARRLGCNKLALGHHRDDVVTTLMMNLFFSGQLKAMPPKLVNDEGDIQVIRPLAYCAEEHIATYAELRAYPIIPCVLCSGQLDHQRRVIGELLAEVDRKHPGVRQRILAALRNVRASHLLDIGLWRKLGLEVASSGPEDEGQGHNLVQLGRRPPASMFAE